MTDLMDDLRAWEAGFISAELVTDRHPDADVSSLLAAHQRLRLAESAPTPDVTTAWAALAPRLPDRSRPALRWRRSIMAAVAAAVITVPGVAYATQAPVRHAVNDLFNTDHPDPDVEPSTGSPAPPAAADADQANRPTAPTVEPTTPDESAPPSVPPAAALPTPPTPTPSVGEDEPDDDPDAATDGEDRPAEDEPATEDVTGDDDHELQDADSDRSGPTDHDGDAPDDAGD